MRYLLVVGFACDVYRREPQARIFVNDQLIDEFHISHYKDRLNPTCKNFIDTMHALQPFLHSELVNISIKNFPPLQFYEIEIDQKLDQINLQIDIKNNDNNHINGFMTANTLIQLQVCYFFPLNQKLLSRLVKIKNKNRLTKNYSWYRKNDINIFDLVFKHIEWRGKNGQNFCINANSRGYNIGGSGYFFCKFVKKYGIFIPKLIKSHRYNFYILFINYFLNKYKQHENQRNTD